MGFRQAQIVTALPGFCAFLPHALPALAAVPLVLAGRGAVGLPAIREKRLPTDGAGLRIRRRPILTDGLFQHRVQREDTPTEIAAERTRPAFPQHVAGTVQRKADVLPAVIVGAPARDKPPDSFPLVPGQLPAHGQCPGPGWPEARGSTIRVRNFFRHRPRRPLHSFKYRHPAQGSVPPRPGRGASFIILSNSLSVKFIPRPPFPRFPLYRRRGRPRPRSHIPRRPCHGPHASGGRP